MKPLQFYHQIMCQWWPKLATTNNCQWLSKGQQKICSSWFESPAFPGTDSFDPLADNFDVDLVMSEHYIIPRSFTEKFLFGYLCQKNSLNAPLIFKRNMFKLVTVQLSIVLLCPKVYFVEFLLYNIDDTWYSFHHPCVVNKG